MDKCCLNSQDKLCRTKQKIVIALKPTAALELLSALGVLGRRLKSCHPDSHINRSKIYQNRVSKVYITFPWNSWICNKKATEVGGLVCIFRLN